MLDPTSDFRLLLSLQYRQQRVIQIAKRDSGDGCEDTGGEEEDAGLVQMGTVYPVSYPLCLNFSFLHTHWVQQDQKIMQVPKEKMDGVANGIKVHVLREESLATSCHKGEY